MGILLDLEDEWTHITTHVFHDKNPACTFHPKVYLFTNSNNARLFVGSNNMTRAGLGTNIEAALGVTGALSDEQKSKLLDIANKCPVSQTLQRASVVLSRLA